MFFRTFFQIYKFLRGQTEVLFKVNVKLDNYHFLSAQMPKYLIYKNVTKCFST